MSCDENWFRFVNWSEFRKDWVERIDCIGERIAECIAEYIKMKIDSQKKDGFKFELKRYNGSYSFIVNGITRGKLAPQCPPEGRLMVGFSSEIEKAERFAKRLTEPNHSPESYVLGPGKKPFLLVTVDPVTNADEICKVMAEFLERCHRV